MVLLVLRGAVKIKRLETVKTIDQGRGGPMLAELIFFLNNKVKSIFTLSGAILS